MNKMKFIEILLEIDSIIIGERIKGGVFRPCQEIIPSATIEGALFHYFGLRIPAVGFFVEGTYMMDEFVYSVRDKLLNISRMPLITNYLSPSNGDMKIRGRVYVPYDDGKDLCDEILDEEFRMGALRSRGFGKCRAVGLQSHDYEIKQGILKVKLFESEIASFGIEEISSIYGYLFSPDRISIGGIYRRALCPGSLVNAPEALTRKVTYYDE
jgi:hypothetical protein